MPKVGVKQKKTESGTDAKLNRNCCAVEHAREIRGDCKPLQINWLATLLADQREVPAGDYNPCAVVTASKASKAGCAGPSMAALRASTTPGGNVDNASS